MRACLFHWYKVQSISEMTLLASIIRLGLSFCHSVVTGISAIWVWNETINEVLCYTYSLKRNKNQLVHIPVL